MLLSRPEGHERTADEMMELDAWPAARACKLPCCSAAGEREEEEEMDVCTGSEVPVFEDGSTRGGMVTSRVCDCKGVCVCMWLVKCVCETGIVIQ